MTPNQKSLLWREWKLAADWYLAHGKTREQLEGLRHLLVRQACGSQLSMADWKRWKNGQVDKVLAKFRAVHDGGNLGAQMAAEEQPAQRLGKMEAEAHNLVRAVYPPQAGEDPGFKWVNMLNGISRRINHCAFEDIKTERQMMAVVGALRVQLKRQQSRADDAEATAEAHAASEAPAAFNVEDHLG